MSYTIMYSSVFIRTRKGVIPMILAGSNNCYEPASFEHKERRERSWFSFTVPGRSHQIRARDAELVDAVAATLPSTYGQHWMRGGKWVDDAGYLRWVKNGCANAYTIEELERISWVAKNGLSARLRVSDKTKDWGEKGAEWDELNTWLTTTQEIDDWVDSAAARMSSLPENCYAEPILSFCGNEPIAVGTRPKRGPIFAKCGKSYCTEVTDRSVAWSRNVADAMEFTGVDDPRLALVSRFDKNTRLVSAMPPKRQSEKNVILLVNSGERSGFYVDKLTRGRVYFSWSKEQAQKKFATVNEAETWAARYIGSRFSGVKSVTAIKL